MVALQRPSVSKRGVFTPWSSQTDKARDEKRSMRSFVVQTEWGRRCGHPSFRPAAKIYAECGAEAAVIRAIRGFSTISYMALTTLAGSPPVELLVEERRVLYWRIREIREEGELSAGDLRALKSQAVARIPETWGDILSHGPYPWGYGRETAEAVRPCLPELAGRRGCGMTFHLVQVLTGQGCSGKYLHRIGKEPTT
ncbi:uncharacterized protein LOC112588333 [Harpegnathos saltator]|uniref:uncharacterized protein LOC112588333 n=1 Tax=Harpegnathos saltator TaxID=610380 RepID=UPI000DBEE3BA|nr:uncharacterized protein LOC112588333 [Harpegnathos saltator]